jgi:hypothetical protein
MWPARRDARLDRPVTIITEPFEDGTTVEAVAASLGIDAEEAMFALIVAGCGGWVVTDLYRWRPASGEQDGSCEASTPAAKRPPA